MDLMKDRIFALIDWPSQFDDACPTAIVGATVEAVHRQAAQEIKRMRDAVAHEPELAALFDVGICPEPDGAHADIVSWLNELHNHAGLSLLVMDGSDVTRTVVQAPTVASPPGGDSPTFTAGDVESALNRAAADIEDACDLPDTGPVDALNLMVNVTAWYLNHPDRRSLRDAIEGSYATSPDEVLSWLTS